MKKNLQWTLQNQLLSENVCKYFIIFNYKSSSLYFFFRVILINLFITQIRELMKGPNVNSIDVKTLDRALRACFHRRGSIPQLDKSQKC